jgi:Lon protease-like protein
MVCPFEPSEKQALLEAKTLAQRAKLMTALIEMGLRQPDGNQPRAPLH